MLESSLFTMLHLLMFAYWLGGDIGVFYASTLLTDDKRDTTGRLAAGKILADVDLVPRFCLLMALPTGLALANSRGWLEIGGAWLAGAFAIAFAWSFLVYQLHVRHTGMETMKRLDTGARFFLFAALASSGAAGLFDVIAMPLFIALKLLILAFTVSMGLTVRIVLKPFGPAYVRLAMQGADPETNETIKSALGKARPAVMAIWLSLGLAAWLGVATPA